MKRIYKTLIALAVLFALAAPTVLFAAEEFLPALERELARIGFEKQEQEMIMIAAREYDWRSVEPEFAEMAALALAVCERARTETKAREQAVLTYHLAAMHQEMKALGFTAREIARIAFKTAREVAEQLRKRSDADNLKGRGEMIRDRIRTELCDAGLKEQEAKIMEQIKNRVQQHGSPDNRRKGKPM